MGMLMYGLAIDPPHQLRSAITIGFAPFSHRNPTVAEMAVWKLRDELQMRIHGWQPDFWRTIRFVVRTLDDAAPLESAFRSEISKHEATVRKICGRDRGLRELVPHAAFWRNPK